jgi:hypothetical protein
VCTKNGKPQCLENTGTGKFNNIILMYYRFKAFQTVAPRVQYGHDFAYVEYQEKLLNLEINFPKLYTIFIPI